MDFFSNEMTDCSIRPNVVATAMSSVKGVPDDTPGSLLAAGPNIIDVLVALFTNIHISGARTVPNLPWPDIGHLAKWSVSSYKFGFGAECLRDGDPETFWQ
jgi:anaphase-promoting complex subunit 10